MSCKHKILELCPTTGFWQRCYYCKKEVVRYVNGKEAMKEHLMDHQDDAQYELDRADEAFADFINGGLDD